MGIGFVLFMYTVIGLIAATISGAAAGAFCLFLARRKGKRGLRAGLIAFAFPFASLAIFGLAFLGYAEFCGTVRDVDPGIGDWWQVPIGHGYTFVMIDVTEIGSVQGADGAEVVRFVSQIGVKGDRAAIVQDIPAGMPAHDSMVEEAMGLKLPSYSILDLRTGKVNSFDDIRSFQVAAGADGITPSDIVSPDAFYMKRRWSFLDLLFPLLAGAVVTISAIFLIKRFRESLRDTPVLGKDKG
jgi:hypothetical protein